MLALAGGLAFSAPAQALPGAGPREIVDVSFTTTLPGVPTGVTFRQEIRHPTDPQREPFALRRLIVGAPEGFVIDTSVPGRCTASDEELRLRGDATCPADSRIGSGSVDLLVTGLGRQSFDTLIFNNSGQQVETVRQGDQVNAVVRGFLTAEGLDAEIPTCVTGGQPPSGCPFDQVRLLSSELVIPALTAGGRSYQTTPPTCPPSGRWRTPIVLSYEDGVTDRIISEQPCEQPTVRTGPREACSSRRRVVLRALARKGLRSVVAVIRGKRRRLDPRRPVIDLRGLPRGRFTVTVSAVTDRGSRLRLVRRYRTCNGS